ncbi:MAG: thioredoxin family protein, partial [Kiritimatiellaeota bacterium]|nr:thioredoxin family protein [Kiritimatiellota bacterium]
MKKYLWLSVLLAGISFAVVAADTTNAPAAGAKPALPKLVDLGAGKCIPCKMMTPILEELKTSHAGKFQVEFIDVWKNPDAGKPYKINLIPTQIFLAADGKELFRH